MHEGDVADLPCRVRGVDGEGRTGRHPGEGPATAGVVSTPTFTTEDNICNDCGKSLSDCDCAGTR